MLKFTTILVNDLKFYQMLTLKKSLSRRIVVFMDHKVSYKTVIDAFLIDQLVFKEMTKVKNVLCCIEKKETYSGKLT